MELSLSSLIKSGPAIINLILCKEAIVSTMIARNDKNLYRLHNSFAAEFVSFHFSLSLSLSLSLSVKILVL